MRDFVSLRLFHQLCVSHFQTPVMQLLPELFTKCLDIWLVIRISSKNSWWLHQLVTLKIMCFSHKLIVCTAKIYVFMFFPVEYLRLLKRLHMLHYVLCCSSENIHSYPSIEIFCRIFAILHYIPLREATCKNKKSDNYLLETSRMDIEQSRKEVSVFVFFKDNQYNKEYI